MRITETIKPKGDANLIKQLRFRYYSLMNEREQIVYLAAREDLTPYQLAEIELAIAKLTGEIKRLDALIMFLVFGYEMPDNKLCRGLHFNYELQKNIHYPQKVRELLDEVYQLRGENAKLKTRNYKLSYRLRNRDEQNIAA